MNDQTACFGMPASPVCSYTGWPMQPQSNTCGLEANMSGDIYTVKFCP